MRTLAVLDCIDRRQMMAVTRETSDHCVRCLRGDVERFRARRIGNDVAVGGVSSLETEAERRKIIGV